MSEILTGMAPSLDFRSNSTRFFVETRRKDGEIYSERWTVGLSELMGWPERNRARLDAAVARADAWSSSSS